VDWKRKFKKSRRGLHVKYLRDGKKKMTAGKDGKVPKKKKELGIGVMAAQEGKAFSREGNSADKPPMPEGGETETKRLDREKSPPEKKRTGEEDSLSAKLDRRLAFGRKKKGRGGAFGSFTWKRGKGAHPTIKRSAVGTVSLQKGGRSH